MYILIHVQNGAVVSKQTFQNNSFLNILKKYYPADELTLSWPAGHIFPTYKESFQVSLDNSSPLFLHVAIYLEVSLFRWTSQNAFSRETAVYNDTVCNTA